MIIWELNVFSFQAFLNIYHSPSDIGLGVLLIVICIVFAITFHSRKKKCPFPNGKFWFMETGNWTKPFPTTYNLPHTPFIITMRICICPTLFEKKEQEQEQEEEVEGEKKKKRWRKFLSDKHCIALRKIYRKVIYIKFICCSTCYFHLNILIVSHESTTKILAFATICE